MSKLLKTIGAIGLALACLAPAWAPATIVPVINVNFKSDPAQFMNGTFAGSLVAPLSYSGQVWTDAVTNGPGKSVTMANLPYSDSSLGSSGVNLTLTTIADEPNNWNTYPILTPLNPMLRGGVYGNASTALILDNLPPNQLYDLYLISDYNNTAGGIFTIGTQSLTSYHTQYTTWQDGANYVHFSRIAPDGNDQIVINIAPYGGFWILNGLQLEAVPEPSSLALFGVGSLLLWIRRRASR